MKDLTDKEFVLLRDYIKNNFGISLGDEKKTLIYSRLRATAIEKGLNDFTEYYNYLINDQSGQAIIGFIDKITTNHTFFMREVDHFDFFKETILPYIEQTYSKERDIRLWCAGCSSGEEPYTLQMIMHDYFKNKPTKWNTQMLATDISTTVLKKSIAGVYPKESVDTLPKTWRTEYFITHPDNTCEVKPAVKNDIAFRKLNLMESSFPFKRKFQVIFCRNVMIYFDNETRNALVRKYYEHTEPGGYLLIGHSESLNHTDTKYKYIMPAVYRKM